MRKKKPKDREFDIYRASPRDESRDDGGDINQVYSVAVYSINIS